MEQRKRTTKGSQYKEKAVPGLADAEDESWLLRRFRVRSERERQPPIASSAAKTEKKQCKSIKKNKRNDNRKKEKRQREEEGRKRERGGEEEGRKREREGEEEGRKRERGRRRREEERQRGRRREKKRESTYLGRFTRRMPRPPIPTNCDLSPSPFL